MSTTYIIVAIAISIAALVFLTLKVSETMADFILKITGKKNTDIGLAVTGGGL